MDDVSKALQCVESQFQTVTDRVLFSFSDSENLMTSSVDALLEQRKVLDELPAIKTDCNRNNAKLKVHSNCLPPVQLDFKPHSF